MQTTKARLIPLMGRLTDDKSRELVLVVATDADDVADVVFAAVSVEAEPEAGMVVGALTGGGPLAYPTCFIHHTG